MVEGCWYFGGCTGMEEKIVVILNEMSEYLSVSQMKKLQEVMLKVFTERTEEKITNTIKKQMVVGIDMM